jgi:glycosyltransferase involved in cell wall biosynthesis
MPQPCRTVLLVSRGLDPVGSGRQVELAAAAFRDAGCRVHVVATTSGGAVPERLAAVGITTHRLAARPVVDAAAAARLVRLGRRLGLGGDDAIVAWGRSQARLAAAVRPLLAGPRLACRLESPPRTRLTGWCLGRADVVIAGSPAVATACTGLGLAADAVVTIPPAALPAEAAGLGRAALAARLGLDPGTLWTLCVAPLEPESHLERLLWAIDQLGVVHRRLEHVLVGAGPQRQRLMRRARVQQVSGRLHLFPHLDCLPDLLREVAIVWQSGEVACGGAVLDGQAVGIPAVAVASAAARQCIADGETGRIVPADPESEFPRRVLGILEDEQLASRYATAAKARAAEAFPAAGMAALVAAVAG